MRASERVALALVFLAPGCRDATNVFESEDRPLQAAETTRLTYSSGDDRFPAWSSNSDTVYYSGYSADHEPLAPATILAVARAGGVARPVLINVQEAANSTMWLLAASLSPDASSVAYLQMRPLRPELPCAALEVFFCPLRDGGESIRLDGVVLRTRAVGAEHSPQDDPSIEIDFADPAEWENIDGFPAWRTLFVPFQRAWHTSREYPSRPSWSPDGTRIATSDGSRILLWEPATGAADTVPGITDATAPAWSPLGDWLAYTWTERTDSTESTCVLGESIDRPFPQPDEIVAQCYETRMEYTTAPPRVAMTRPDGSARLVIDAGRDPAWTPSGELVFAGPGFQPGQEELRLYDPANGGMTTIHGTAGAREPAVSPDGQWVAYSSFGSRREPRDIFVSRLR